MSDTVLGPENTAMKKRDKKQFNIQVNKKNSKE